PRRRLPVLPLLRLVEAMQLIAALLVAASGGPLDIGLPFLLEESLLTRAELSAPALYAEADRVAAENPDGGEGPVTRPEPPEDGRIRVSRGSYRNRYALDERRFGVAIQPGFAMIQGGSVVKNA